MLNNHFLIKYFLSITKTNYFFWYCEAGSAAWPAAMLLQMRFRFIKRHWQRAEKMPPRLFLTRSNGGRRADNPDPR